MARVARTSVVQGEYVRAESLDGCLLNCVNENSCRLTLFTSSAVELGVSSSTHKIQSTINNTNESISALKYSQFVVKPRMMSLSNIYQLTKKKRTKCSGFSIPQEFEEFNKRLGDVSRHVRVPLPVSNVLWEHCIRLANRTLVEG